MSNTQKVSPFPTATVADDGYIPTAERWKSMLDAYPPKDGWSVTVQGTPAESPLYYTGGDTAAPTIRFEAVLRNSSGNVVANGSTLYIVDATRDWECGETNARHRLLMALGFNPRKMDEDDRENHVRASGAGTQPVSKLPFTGTAPAPALVGATAAPVEEQSDPLAGVALVQVGEDRQRKPRVPRAKPVAVTVPPVDPQSKADAEEGENPLGPASTNVAPIAKKSANVAPAAVVGANDPGVSGDDPSQDIGTPPANLGPLKDAIQQRAVQRDIGVDWTTITDDKSAVAWLLAHT